MENQNTNPTAVKTVSIDREFVIKCSIRRKPNLPKGIPGESPLSRTYKLSASIAKGGRGPLKGITGDLERIVMPSIVNVNPNEPDFYNKINHYWNEIGVVIPSDEEAVGKDKGKVIEIRGVLSFGAKKQLEAKESIEEKIEVLKEALLRKEAIIFEEHLPDFLLLSFALLRSSVANKYEDVYKSTSILFYISDSDSTIKQKLSFIEKVGNASKLFNTVAEDDIKVKSILTLLKIDMADLDTPEERIIALHQNYTTPANVDKFLAYVEDRDLLIKYLISTAIINQNLREQPNTGNIYYNDILIGKGLDQAVAYLKSAEKEAREILRSLEGELGIKSGIDTSVVNA